MYLVKLNGMIIGLEELDNEHVIEREKAGFTVEKIKKSIDK